MTIFRERRATLAISDFRALNCTSPYDVSLLFRFSHPGHMCSYQSATAVCLFTALREFESKEEIPVTLLL